MSDLRPVSRIEGTAVAFRYSDVDTDSIFPVSHERVAAEHGFGAALFGRWREEPGFVLNRSEYAGARILLAGPDFGIGSSRETAVWALRDAGFEAVLAPSFGDIFRTNCVRNRLLTATIAAEDVEVLWDDLEATLGATVLDLVEQRATLPSGTTIHLGIDGFARRCLLEGVDELGLLRSHQDRIDAVLATTTTYAFDTRRVASSPPSRGEHHG